MHDKIQFFMHQQDADGTTNKQAQFMIDYSGTSAVGSASLPWDWGYFGSIQLSNALGLANGGTGGKNVNTARENLDAAKASVTSTYSTLSGSNEVTGSLSDSVHTKFTLDQLLAWLEEQGLGGSSVDYPITVANGGTSATTQKAAEYNIINPTPVNGIPTMDDEVVFINGSASSSNGRLSSYKLSYAYVPIFSQIMGEVFTGSGGTLPVNSGGTGVTSISALRSSLKLYSGSKVINNGDTFAVLFSNSEYAGITGRGFNVGTDCVLVMNGDADATQTEFYCTTWKASTGNIGIFCGSAGARRVNYFIIAP